MSVPEGGVGDLDRDPLPQVGGKACRTEIEKALPRALGRGIVEIDSGRPFLPGSSWVGAGPCGWLTVTSASQRSNLVPRSAGA